MLDALKKEMNVTFTENGEVAKSTTGSSLLDFFAQAGAMRNTNEQDIISSFTKALSENELLALKALFYFRDLRGGQGERRLFKIIAEYLATRHKDLIKKNLHLIPEYGRWDDLYAFFGTPLEKNVVNLFKKQLKMDLKSDNPSLLAKWLKSENTSSQESKRLARKTRMRLGLSSRRYRKILSTLRSKINLLESKMSTNSWSSIDYSKVPSQASLKYRKAFYRHDEEGYQAYLDSLTKGEAKVNASTLYPYQLVKKADYYNSWFTRSSTLSSQEEQLINEMWNNIPDYLNGKEENSIAVIDTSGSMYGLPMEVAISLGLYMAERNKGEFYNHFITFSDRPELQQVKGKTFCERVRNIAKASWGMSTNLEAVFDLVLNTATKNDLSQDEMVDKLYIISDMEFNRCVLGGTNKTLFEKMRERYASHGYKLPELVFWNVNARNQQFPVTMNDTGVQLVSGFSPTLFEQIVSGKSAYDLMIDILTGERYEAITV